MWHSWLSHCLEHLLVSSLLLTKKPAGQRGWPRSGPCHSLWEIRLGSLAPGSNMVQLRLLKALGKYHSSTPTPTPPVSLSLSPFFLSLLTHLSLCFQINNKLKKDTKILKKKNQPGNSVNEKL